MPAYETRPLWWGEAGLPESLPHETADALPGRAETVIVGAGYSGLSAALTLARAGREVLVLDSEAVGFGCSSRNGGLIGPSFHKLGLAGLRAAYGEGRAQAILRESMESLDYVKSFISNEKIDCDLKICGRFRGAVKPPHYDAMAREGEGLAKATGLEFEMVPRSEQYREIGSEHYHGGIVYPNDGHLQPAKYLKGLAEKVLEAGGRLFAPAKVTHIFKEEPEIEVVAAGRRIWTRQILIATNGYSGLELPYFRRRIIPLRSAIIATEPLDAEIAKSLSPKGRGFGESSRLVLYYRPYGRRLVFGGRAFDLSDRPDRYVPDLVRLMTRIYPQLQDCGISHAWSGTVAYTFDHAPHIGCHDRLYFVMGYCGSGVGRASYFGRKAALKMLGRKDGRTSLDGLEFPTRPLYSGMPWFLPFILRWHSLADRMGL